MSAVLFLLFFFLSFFCGVEGEGETRPLKGCGVGIEKNTMLAYLPCTAIVVLPVRHIR